MLSDEKWMQLAIEQARKGMGTVSPNPAVGALLVDRGKVLVTGYHRFAGGPHAEVVVLGKVRRIPKTACLYVTLEPCFTVGRTPACTDLIVRRGIRRVVVGTMDPNPLHRGRGLRILRQHKVRVRVGVETEACRALNPAFHKYITGRIPYGTGKMAMSLDGKVATRTGDSQWISSPSSRRLVQEIRHQADAVLVGAGTIRRDDPRLTIRDKRLPRKRKPFLRVVADSELTLPLSARVFRPVTGHKTWIATTAQAIRRRGQAYRRKGIGLLAVRPSPEGISLRDLFTQLGKREICHVLVEGGPTLMASCLKEGVLDKLMLFVAPIILGGRQAPGPVGGRGVARMRQAIFCNTWQLQPIGQDFLIEALLKK